MSGKDLIKEQFDKLVSITPADWLYFSERLQFKQFGKKDRITQADRVEDNLYFLAHGVVRFIVHNEEKETTTDFSFSGHFFCSYSSFITRQPGIFEIRPVTKTASCYYISWNDLQQVYANTNCGEKIGRMAAEQQFIRKSDREVSLLTIHPKDRYLQLMEEQPQWIHQIPLKHLASYLGITPETLSRIRSSIMKSNG
ncbi:MAG: hypothetical protein LAT57_05745 [Balneolales bacterium]|nr:hypothetical protein [Balneolales bacterium]